MKLKLQHFYLGIFLIAAITSIVILYHSNNNPPPHPKKIVSTFINNATYKTFNEKGKLTSIMKAKHVTQFTNDRDTFFAMPHILTYTTKGTPWVITADQAKSNAATNQILLWGHVLLIELSASKKAVTTIKTSELTVFPKQSRATTNKAVSIYRKKSVIKGKGLVADLKQGMYELLSQSKGIYTP